MMWFFKDIHLYQHLFELAQRQKKAVDLLPASDPEKAKVALEVLMLVHATEKFLALTEKPLMQEQGHDFMSTEDEECLFMDIATLRCETEEWLGGILEVHNGICQQQHYTDKQKRQESFGVEDLDEGQG